jgi:predicted unusual protein kinase regulating ubiquinone biosynthesis (AarF/ABC1/UbiB family)
MEEEFEADYSFLREMFCGPEGRYYTGIGTSMREEFIDMLLYGTNGIFAEEVTTIRFDYVPVHVMGYGTHMAPIPYKSTHKNIVSKKMFNEIFETLYPQYADANKSENDRRELYKGIYDLLLSSADPYRKGQVLSALASKLPEIKKMPSNSIEEMRKREAEAIGALFESFGLASVKLGQILSHSRLVDLTDEIRTKLASLRDDTAPMNKSNVFEMIDRVYGQGNFESRFGSLVRNLHNASIKATYEVVDSEGDKYVLKVKRPDAEQRIEQEMAFLRDVANGLKDVLGIRIPQQMIRHLEKRIRGELDFNNEVRNQNTLSEALEITLAGWRDADISEYEFHVPKAKSVEANSLILEEFAEGVPATDTKGLIRLGVDPQQIESILGKLFFRMIFIAGFYHADPHLGNVFVSRTPEGKVKISIIDLGAAHSISKTSRENLWRLMTNISSVGRHIPLSSRKALGSIRGITVEPERITDNTEKEIRQILDSDDKAINKFLDVITILENNDITVKSDVMELFIFLSAYTGMFEFKDTSTAGQLAMLYSTKKPLWKTIEEPSAKTASAGKISPEEATPLYRGRTSAYITDSQHPGSSYLGDTPNQYGIITDISTLERDSDFERIKQVAGFRSSGDVHQVRQALIVPEGSNKDDWKNVLRDKGLVVDGDNLDAEIKYASEIIGWAGQNQSIPISIIAGSNITNPGEVLSSIYKDRKGDRRGVNLPFMILQREPAQGFNIDGSIYCFEELLYQALLKLKDHDNILKQITDAKSENDIIGKLIVMLPAIDSQEFLKEAENIKRAMDAVAKAA